MNNIFESNGNTWVQLFKNRGLKPEKIEEIKQVPLYWLKEWLSKRHYHSLHMLTEGDTQVPDIKSRLSFAQWIVCGP